jgi:tetratricopeptide (TPR) repeat protein
VIIDPFESAPALAADGVDGKVVASGLLDVLSRIQANTRSNAKRRLLSDAWTNDITIEIPEMGVSIGELERVLKDRLGHDQHIGGELIRTREGGLAMTVRGSRILAKTFTDPGQNLQKLETQAGEYLYGQSQPGLWAAYLSNHNRNDEAIYFAKNAYAGADPAEKPYLLNYWANALVGKGEKEAMSDALRLYRQALSLKPDFWIGYTNIMNALYATGKEEDVVREGELLKRVAGGRPGKAPGDSFENYDSTVWDLPAERAEQIADMSSYGGIGSISRASGAEVLNLANTEALMHDVRSATFLLMTAPIDPANAPDVAIAEVVRATLAAEVGDFKAAAERWDLYAAAYANSTVSAQNPSEICLSALSYERTGQSAKADAALAAIGTLTFVDCYRYRGDLEDLRGHWQAAQAAYRQAVALAPSIPSSYYSWGAALVRHGDLEGAIAKFTEAHRKGPHWADPLKAWGDLLAGTNQWSQALAKYNEALKYAPNWAALNTAREMAAKH